MAPALEMHALGVLAGEEVGFELFVRGAGAEALEMRLAARGEFRITSYNVCYTKLLRTV